MIRLRYPVSCIVVAAAAFPGGMSPAVAAVVPAESVVVEVRPETLTPPSLVAGETALAQEAHDETAEAVEAVLLDRDMVFQEVVVGPGGVVAEVGGGGGVAGDEGRLIYSNTLGIHSFYITNSLVNLPISDDIATTAPDGCNLRSFKFKVLGKVLNPSPSAPPTSGPYTVKYALYTTCPLAVGATNALRDLVRIPGTIGEITFPDDGPRAIKHVVDPHYPVAIPTNVYFGLQFNRSNCGTVVGAPAMVGFSGDVLDFPGFSCNGFFGGFPQLPHASFWLEMYGDESCLRSFPGYKSAKASGVTITLGAGIQGVDDVKLQVDDCQMVGYEVTVRGAGFYSFDLRRQCDGQIIPGTERSFLVSAGTTPLLQIARFMFDPPIPLDEELWFGFRCVSAPPHSCGVVLAGLEPIIGTNEVDFFTVGLEGCETIAPTQGVHGAINLAITFAGVQPVGACCDMALLECEGAEGPTRCATNATCPAGTTCEAVCREVPEMNCPWPLRGQILNPAWVEGGQCETDPFELPCGVAACCKPDDTCENLTRNECNAVPPIESARLWQAGQYCGQGSQACPFSACLARAGDCTAVHDGVGCSDPFCCTDVCTLDPWCCHVEWDRRCVEQANLHCPRSPSNNTCLPFSNGFGGAAILTHNVPYFGSNSYASGSLGDQGFCCHTGIGLCEGGNSAGSSCLVDLECVGGFCSDLVPVPGGLGLGTVWFKFVATHESAEISTCASELEGDTLVNVYGGDHAAPCGNLQLIACGDDGGCPYDNKSYTSPHSRFCVDGLIAGETYYVMLGSKLAQRQGIYQIEIKFPCQDLTPFPSSDCNANGAIDGCDLVDGTSDDCNENLSPDECDILSGDDQDCNENHFPDSCDIQMMQSFDCDGNAIPDECEIIAGAYDCDFDGVPDSCDLFRGRIQFADSSSVFAAAVAVDKDWLFVSDAGDYSTENRGGRVHAYKWQENRWAPFQSLQSSESKVGDGFGTSIAVSGGQLFVGAPGFRGPLPTPVGAVFVFDFDDEVHWIEVQKVTPFGEGPTQFFGSSLAAYDDRLAIGAFEGTTTYGGLGRVFVFRSDGERWIADVRLQPLASDRVVGWYGSALASSEDSLFISNPDGGSYGGGVIYVYDHTQSHPALLQTLEISKTVGMFSSIGKSLAVGGDHLLAGGDGVAVAFERNYVKWEFGQVITPDDENLRGFGAAVAIQGADAVIGAWASDTLEAGLARAYHYEDGRWKESGILVDDDVPDYLVRHVDVAMFGHRLLIGTSTADPPVLNYPPSVHVFAFPLRDCDDNNVPDLCETDSGQAKDCNGNSTPDSCEPQTLGDFDFSKRVDLFDFGALQRCLPGFGVTSTCCGVFDAEPKDGDADLADFAAFVGAMRGP